MPVESLDALNDRLSALKGPKAGPADMQNLEHRLDILKGRNKEPPSWLELDGRLAKLKGSSGTQKGKLAALDGRLEGELLPDFDPDVELNEQQLEALANMSDHDPDTVDADQDDFAAEASTSSTDDATAGQHQPVKSGASLKSGAGHQTAAGRFVSGRPDVSQVVLDMEAEEELSHEQLLALANMGPSSAAAAAPAWAAALGLSAQDLWHDSGAASSAEQVAARPGAQPVKKGHSPASNKSSI